MLPSKFCKRRSGSNSYYHVFLGFGRQEIMADYIIVYLLLWFSCTMIRSTPRSKPFLERALSTFDFHRRVWTQVLSIWWGQPDKDTRWCSNSESQMPNEKRSIRKMCTCAGSNRQPSADGIRVILILQWSCHLFVFRKWFILGNGHGWPSIRRFGIHTGPY